MDKIVINTELRRLQQAAAQPKSYFCPSIIISTVWPNINQIPFLLFLPLFSALYTYKFYSSQLLFLAFKVSIKIITPTDSLAWIYPDLSRPLSWRLPDRGLKCYLWGWSYDPTLFYYCNLRLHLKPSPGFPAISRLITATKVQINHSIGTKSPHLTVCSSLALQSDLSLADLLPHVTFNNLC